MRRTDIVGQAFRNVRRQRLRSALTIFAVMIGATSVTIMLALVTGAKEFFLSQFESSGQLQHVIVTQSTDLDYKSAQNGSSGGGDSTGTPLTDALATQITSIPHVVGLARTVQQGGALDSMTYNGKKLSVQGVQAYDPNGIVKQTLVAGRQLGSKDGVGVALLSKAYADKLGFSGNYAGFVGKTVVLETRSGYSGVGATIAPPPQCTPGQPCGGGQPQQNPPTTFNTTVVGVTDDDSPNVYVSLDWAVGLATFQMYQGSQPQQQSCNHPGPCGSSQPEFHLCTYVPFTTTKQPEGCPTGQENNNSYSTFVVQVDQSTNTDPVATQIRRKGVGAVTAQSFIQEQLNIFTIISLVMGGIGGIALLVAAIGVINTMVMAILERTREIGVLRACGATKAMIRQMFTVEAATLGFLGGVCGVGLGYLLTLLANGFINKQLSSSGVSATNIIGLPLWLIASVIGATTLIGMLAGLFPAARAARLDPIEALRYE